ncbi:Sialin [Halotydeus destructor]|nr:Sialin [Halotydeus destructor]
MVKKLFQKNGKYNRISQCHGDSKCSIPVRWLIVTIVVLSCAVDYITRVNINVAIVSMVKPHAHAHNVSAGTCPFQADPGQVGHDVHHHANGNRTYDWSPKTQGIVLGSFWYSYMCMQVPSARLAEEVGGKWIVAVSLIGSGVVNMITPLISDWLTALIASRVVLGVLQGGIFPSCYAMLYKWMPQKERSLALAFMDVGGTIGSIVAASLTGYLSEHGFAGGWPSSFYVSGIISLVTFVLWVTLVSSTPEEHHLITEEELDYIRKHRGNGQNAGGVKGSRTRPPVPWRAILTSSPVIAVIISKFSLGWTFFTILSKLPAYLNDVLHVSPTENGLLNASLYTATIISLLTAGHISEKMIQIGWFSRTRCRKMFAAIASLGAATCLAIVPSVGCNKTAVMMLFITSNFLMGCGSGGDGPVPSELTTNFPATIFSIANMVACSSGFVAPYVIGVILESKAGDLQYLWSIIFYLASAIAGTGIMAFLFFGSADIQPWDAPTDPSGQGMTMLSTEGSDDEWFNINQHRSDVRLNSLGSQ